MIHLPNAQATAKLGAQIAQALLTWDRGLVMALHGELGAGKTALARATVIALGYTGVVVSPTYTLLETYAVAGRHLHHLDLYRLVDPGELEFVGLRDLDVGRDWFLIEWPQQGAGHLPAVDIQIVLHHAGTARNAELLPLSATGSAVVQTLICPDSSVISTK